eukprot:TRINITY_DN54727_c0_g1_i1.p1 TRINITY_DN54727_c0_g1~~TRINITY_DN54727_c0_g1_i1.p1  ORF type:complete len:317 (-),score=49.63 TRINITY_DN54727_c0_g1_i1:123-998(-)
MTQAGFLGLFAATLSAFVAATNSVRSPTQEASKFLSSGSHISKQFFFDQRLLICNAYRGPDRAIVDRNDHEILAPVDNGIAYRECRYMPVHMAPGDRLDFNLKGAGVHGTFEVGQLPASDAVLLLVFEQKKKGSSGMLFKSFAFPQPRGSEAQLAIIDTFKGNSTAAAQLKIEDHISGKKTDKDVRRVEQMFFNHVYAVDEGVYDASVLELVGGTPNAANVAAMEAAARTIKLSKHQNYVILRTGDPSDGEPQSLVVFPDAGGAWRCSSVQLPATVLTIFAFFVVLGDARQ